MLCWWCSPSSIPLSFKDYASLLWGETFALNRGLSFNASKSQLIRFSSSLSSSCAAHIYFCGIELPFLDTVMHLGHLHYINLKLKDMVRKANCLFASFLVFLLLLCLACFSPTVFLYMVLASGHFLLLVSIILRWLSTRFCLLLPTVLPLLFVLSSVILLSSATHF